MTQTSVDADWLGSMRLFVDAVNECMTDEFKKELNEYVNFDSLAARVARGEPQHPIDDIGTFSDIPKVLGIVTDEEYLSLRVAWHVLRTRMGKYRKAMNAVEAWIPSHDQGEVWNSLHYREAQLAIAAVTLKSVMGERSTPEWCAEHPGGTGCPE